MTQFLYGIVEVISNLHNYFLSLNDHFETSFTDKTLHFLIIGAFGMLMVLVVHPLFTWLAKNDHTIVITFLYVFTVILVIVFAIEIGQGVSGSGSMDFADIMYGVVGFLAFFLLFAIARAIYKLVRGMLK
ncbi:MAG: hypothetical protein IJ132_01315 [Firmicutes bacterium]|nr:hypothetical protein [Bacillota bacterium]